MCIYIYIYIYIYIFDSAAARSRSCSTPPSVRTSSTAWRRRSPTRSLRIHIHMCVHMCIHMCVYIHIYIYIYIYTYRKLHSFMCFIIVNVIGIIIISSSSSMIIIIVDITMCKECCQMAHLDFLKEQDGWETQVPEGTQRDWRRGGHKRQSAWSCHYANMLQPSMSYFDRGLNPFVLDLLSSEVGVFVPFSVPAPGVRMMVKARRISMAQLFLRASKSESCLRLLWAILTALF